VPIGALEVETLVDRVVRTSLVVVESTKVAEREVAVAVVVDKERRTDDAGINVVGANDNWTIVVEREVEVEVVVDKVLGAAGLNIVGTAVAITDDTGTRVVGTAVDSVEGPLPERS
jgi:hypothetical protein